MSAARLCVGVIVGAHGVRGQVKVKSFTEAPADFAAYGPLSDAAGARTFEVSAVGRAKGTVVAAIAGVRDRNAAEALRGTELFVARAALPEPDEEETYYHADLVGLAVEDAEGHPVGEVAALDNHGAGDVIEIAPNGGGMPLILPFTRAVVPEIDLEAGRMVVVVPPEA